jgi:hypothetical protein
MAYRRCCVSDPEPLSNTVFARVALIFGVPEIDHRILSKRISKINRRILARRSSLIDYRIISGRFPKIDHGIICNRFPKINHWYLYGGLSRMPFGTLVGHFRVEKRTPGVDRRRLCDVNSVKDEQDNRDEREG